jgi:hypothetical protein
MSKTEDNSLNLFEKKWIGGMSPVDAFVWGARLFRKIGLKKIVRAVRNRSTQGLFLRLHTEVIHNMRMLGVKLNHWDHNDSETLTLVGDVCNVCNACNDLMSDLLEIDKYHMHCCIKVLVKRPNIEEDLVETWMRSDPSDGRNEDDDPNSHLVSKTSTWSALLGRFDGKYNWEKPFCCFSCNDLLDNADVYQNSRNGWEKYYRSTLVFPLRYPTYEGRQRKYNVVGFLAFDSSKKNAFVSLPNIFDYRDNINKISDYQSLLAASAPFHLGAIMADTLSTIMKPTYDQYIKRGG